MKNLFLWLFGGLMLWFKPSRVQDGGALDEWSVFKSQHGKSYESAEVDQYRRKIFSDNKVLIEEFNAVESASVGFKLGLSHLSDLSEHEVKLMRGHRPRGGAQVSNTPEAQRFLDAILEDNSTEVPDELDWRKVPGRVTRVKDQGACGSCWAFAAVGVLEGQEASRRAGLSRPARRSGKLVELSEQNLVDCTVDDVGCSGGLVQNALDQVQAEGGIESERDYPYEESQEECRFVKRKSAFTDAGHAILPNADEEELRKVVARFGPVAVAIDASDPTFHHYKSGVYATKACGSLEHDLDHAVLVVGYGTDPEWGDYWIIKNSWASDWGESGYIRMARNRDNMCGVATRPVIATF